MPVAGAPGRDGRDVLVHRALVYGTLREFALAAVPYLRAGRREGDTLVVIAAPPVWALLREQFGAGTGARIEFIDAADWFRGPMQALASYYDRMRADWWPRGRLRLLAEPVWAGRTPLEVREWKRHESILNVAFAGTPTSIMCAYDASALPAHVVDDAARTHPELAGPEGTRPSGRYTDPAAFYAECNAAPLSPPPATAARRAFASGELPGLRAFLGAEAVRLGLPKDRSLPFVLAVNEVATNIIREGGGHGSLWVWAEADELVCDVTDPRSALNDRFLGYAPPRGRHRGEAAMWAVRRLCHIVEIRSGDGGTRIRMHVRLP
ncbi:sensor histidine kinase [Actinomadura rubrisoli]|uniref:Sensor histidine kinase n=2 Tax=Actinomadura rubrisoli TaxID=2530368 RepID=A0A4R5A3L3_9ACTN|nr:sensor histidine kinase [Actinomadura rubrisoli]TDD65244.1 sensor histidine kinase [Actinomadura rubrisoli]